MIQRYPSRRIFLVTYQLRPQRANNEIISALQSFEEWWHFLDWTWLISTAETAEGIYSRLAPFLHQNDRELIIEIKPGSSFAGWLPKDAWGWIEQRVGPATGRPYR